MKNKGRNINNIAQSNRALVTRLIYTGQCRTRAELSCATGLTKMTVSNIVGDLIRTKWIAEGTKINNSNTGRNPIGLYPDPYHRNVIGVYISRDKLTVSAVGPNAKILAGNEFPLSAGLTADMLITLLVEKVRGMIKDIGKKRFIGIGVACIGPVDIKNGILLSPPDFYGIKNIGIKEILEKETGLETVVNNDMNAAALAELLYGEGSRCHDFTYVGITHGIGAGIVINGKLYTGAGGFSGELGHVSIDSEGPLCSCNNKGCVEIYASIPNFIAMVKEKQDRDISFEKIVEMAKNEDSSAVEMMDYFISKVSSALVSCVNMLNPEKIFIGHDAAAGGEWLAGKLEDEVCARSFLPGGKPVSVSISSFGKDAPVIGSAVLYYDSVFNVL